MATPPDDQRRPGDDDALWREFTRDVKRDEDPRREDKLRRAGKPKVGEVPSADPPDALSSSRAFDITHDDELVSGRQPDFPARDVRLLRQGQPPHEDVISLRHLRVADARGTLEQAIPAARLLGVRCLLVITGRGSAEAGSGVIRAELPGWLSRGELARHVNAFTSAQPRDGGVGAFYVLLRR